MSDGQKALVGTLFVTFMLGMLAGMLLESNL